MMRLTQTQGKRLCELVHLLRPEWDIPGIEAAVRKAADVATAAEVASAACALAANPAIRTPGMLHQPGAHWPKGEQYAGPRPSNDVHCPEHPQQVHPCPDCATKRTPPPPDYLEAKKAVLATTAKPKPAEPRHKPTPAEELARARARADRGQQ